MINKGFEPLAYFPEEVSLVMPLSGSAVRKLIADGKLPKRKRGVRIIVLHDDLVTFIRNLPPYD